MIQADLFSEPEAPARPKRERKIVPPLPVTYTYLSLGAGVQSTAVLAMSALGLRGCPKADVAIFADTQDEPKWVYTHLAVLEKWGAEHGLPVVRTTHGCLSADVEARHRGEKPRFAAIPAWTTGSNGRASPLRRQCTREYKITPIEKKIRELMGFKKGERIAGKKMAGCLIGISYDEIERMKPSRTPWVTSMHPLVEARMTRNDCLKLIKEVGLPTPRKSSCVFCPYHSDSFWRDLQTNYPDEFARAAKFDTIIRDMSASGDRRPVFLHRSLKPLDQIDFSKKNDPQAELEGFGNECEGHCGV